MTIHDRRHASASLAVRSGAHVKAPQKMLGHASASMTLDVYADLFDDDLDGGCGAFMMLQLLQVRARCGQSHREQASLGHRKRARGPGLRASNGGGT